MAETVNEFTLPNSEHCRRELLRYRWFADLPADAIEHLVSCARLRNLSDGQCLHRKGDPGDGLYGVLSGGIKVSSSSADGREAVLTILEPGSWFGEISLFDNQPRTHDGWAQGATQLLMIPRAGFQQLLKQRPELYAHFVQLLCWHIRLSFSVIEDTAFLPLEGRLAKRLLMLAEGYGRTEARGTRLQLHVSQEMLGLMLQASRQSINKHLKDWERAGVVSLHYGSLTIHQHDTLEQIAQSH